MKIKLLLSIISLSLLSFSQPWASQIKKSSSMGSITLSEYQSAFDLYWVDKDVQNGHYIENGIAKKAYGWKQFKRWENYWITRVDKETGAFPSQNQYKAAEYQYQQSVSQNHSLSGQWSNLGPSSTAGGYAGVGRISTIAFHPSDANTYWIGAPTGGLWKTTDNGTSWNVLTDQNEVLGVSAIGIPSDYSSSQTIYIGTGDRDSWHHDNGNGIFKSTDGGLTWNVSLAFNVANGYTVNQLLIHPTNNNIIYAATTDGIYKTTDGGANWTNIYDINYISDLEFNPADPSILYAASKWYGTIYKLTNNGANAVEVYNDPDANRIELTVTADNSNLVYAIVSNSDYGLKGILKSTNQGDSFSFVTDTPNILSSSADGSGTSGQGWYDLALIVDPNDQDVLYSGGVNTWRSNDGGENWEIVNHWWGDGVQAVHADKHFFAYQNGTLFECNDGGMYNTNDGTNWNNISNGIINSQIYKLSVSQTESNATIIGLQDNGTKLLATDDNWYDVKGGDGMACLIDYSDYNIQYGSYVYGQITRTTDGWSGNYTDIEPTGAGDGAWVTPYIIHPSTPSTLYAGYADVWKTTDRGDSWTQISNINSSDLLRTMAISESNPNTLYVADLSQIWKTNDDGGAWTDVTSNLPSNDITAITIKNDDPNTVWVTLGSYDSDVIYQTTNGGSNWTNISMGLPSIPANTVVQNTQNTSETELYIGTDFGVYIKHGTSNWELFNNGMPKVTISDLSIYYDVISADSKIRAASWGRGLWESDLYSVLPPVADFSANQTEICIDDIISFTDLSINTPTSWTWSISPSSGYTYVNGTDANTQNPQISFSQSGSYSITLTATNGGGSDDEIKTNYVIVNAIPVAEFSADQTTITEGETVNYTDLSSNSPDAWSWSFNGGIPNSSANQNPSITYNIAGTYQVELTASKSSCSDTESKTAFIHVNALSTSPVADFSADQTEICIDDIISFTDLSSNSPTSWIWSIAPSLGYIYVNGTDANSQNPEISFTADGVYSITLSATNGDGTDDEIKTDYIIVNNVPDQPSPIDGEANICESSLETYSVTDVSGLTYNWTLPSGWSGSSSTNSISVVSNNAGGTISVTAENTCGISISQSINVNITPIPNSPIFDQSPTVVCDNEQVVYSVIQTSGYSYNWNLPTSWIGASNINSITATANATNGYVYVSANNSCGEGAKDSVWVTVNTVPLAPVFINPPAEVCNGSENTFTVDNEVGNIYYWTIPVGWSGSSTTNAINLTNDGTSGDLSVYAENICGTGSPTSISIGINNIGADQPSVISGPNPVCENSTVSYSVVNVSGVTYYWSLPSGWSGNGNMSTINVTTNSNGGTITLVPFNACGMGIARTLNVSVNQQIGIVSEITGNSDVCENSTQTYSITAENASNYIWSLPSGWSGNSLYNNINTTVGSTGGLISVIAENACGVAPAVSLPVQVSLLPISNFSYTSNQAEYTFNNLSQNADSYYWDFGDTESAVDANPIHTYTISGTYNVNLTAENQCAQRNYYSTINVIVLDLSTLNQLGLTVFPNPSSGIIRIKGLLNDKARVMLVDATGKVIFDKFMDAYTKDLSINLDAYSDGVYQIIITQNNEIYKQTIILEK